MGFKGKNFRHFLVARAVFVWAIPIFILLGLLHVPASQAGTLASSPFPCGANPEKIWDVNLSFVTKAGIRNDIKLMVPETYLLELSRTTSERKSAHLHATYDNLEPPCVEVAGKYTPIVKNNLLSLYIKAKPKGNNNAIQYWINNTRKSWSKIEDNAHPSFEHYIRPKGILPQSILIPKKELAAHDAYYLECQGIIPNRTFKNSSCRVNYNYRDILNVGANFPATHVNETEQVIKKSSKLIDKFSAKQIQGE